MSYDSGPSWNPRTLQNEADRFCKNCLGKGMHAYATTAIFGGAGGASITNGPCECTQTWKDAHARQGGQAGEVES